MQSHIEDILSELFALNPDLRARESELRRIISAMVESRPESTLDEWFHIELRAKLDREIGKMKQESRPSSSRSFSWVVPFLLGGAVFASFMVVSPVGQYFHDMFVAPASTVDPKAPNRELALRNTPPPSESESVSSGSHTSKNIFSEKTSTNGARLTGSTVSPPSPASLNSDRPTIARQPTVSTRTNIMAFGLNVFRTGPNAFGKISADNVGGAGRGGGWAALLGASPSMEAEDKALAPSFAQDAMIAPHQSTEYRYVYTGADIPLPKLLPVFRKEQKRFESADLWKLLSTFRFSLFDLGGLSDLRLDTMVLSEDHEYGLTTNIDLNEGVISVSKNWTKWPQSKCQTDECFSKERLKPSDIPDDSMLLSLADAFVKKHHVDTSHYGKPSVDVEWRREFSRSNGENSAYVPDTIRVVYPLQMDGINVYEEYGARKWLSVGVDVKSKKVSEFIGVENLYFTASDYPIDSDWARIRALVVWSMHSIVSADATKNGSGGTMDLPLKTPDLVYVHINRYQNGRSTEYLVPALRFETSITPADEGISSRSDVIIPIIRDFQAGAPGYSSSK